MSAPKEMAAKFPGTCKVCKGKFPSGYVIFWQKGMGAWCGIHGPLGDQNLDHVKPVTPTSNESALPNASALYALFATASENLKRPKLRFELRGTGRIQLYRSGPNSKVPGAINVVDDAYGGRWWGRLLEDGTWQFRASNPEPQRQAIEVLLEQLCDDPVAVSAEHGKLGGNCCFCNTKLSAENSTDAGYGATCAKKWGLPWGKKAKAKAVSDETAKANFGMDWSEPETEPTIDEEHAEWLEKSA